MGPPVSRRGRFCRALGPMLFFTVGFCSVGLGGERASTACGNGIAGEGESGAAALHALVLAEGDDDSQLLSNLKLLGVNVIVGNVPKKSAAIAAHDAGLCYLTFLSARSAERLETDAAFLAEIGEVAAVPSFAGFHYLDDTVEEGYTSPEVQQRTYARLKKFFPGKLALYPLRLDLVASDPAYLDENFRPEFTDLVAPYFYPVGRTTLGALSYGEDWESLLLSLLRCVRERLSAGKKVLPVLQGFEEAGFPVEEDFLQRQLSIYGLLWSDNSNVAAFAWFDQVPPLAGMARSPALQSGFRRVCESLPEAGAPPFDNGGGQTPTAGAGHE